MRVYSLVTSNLIRAYPLVISKLMRVYPLVTSKLMRVYLNFFSFPHGTRLATHMASNNLLILFLSLVIKTLSRLSKFPISLGYGCVFARNCILLHNYSRFYNLERNSAVSQFFNSSIALFGNRKMCGSQL